MGRDQIYAAAQKLHLLDIVPQKIYTSSAARAQETLFTFKAHNRFSLIDSATLQELTERDFGAWEGLPFEEIKSALYAGNIGEGGEHRHDFSLRVKDVFNTIEEEGHALPLIISHGLVWQELHDAQGVPAPWIRNGDVFFVHRKENSLTSKLL